MSGEGDGGDVVVYGGNFGELIMFDICEQVKESYWNGCDNELIIGLEEKSDTYGNSNSWKIIFHAI